MLWAGTRWSRSSRKMISEGEGDAEGETDEGLPGDGVAVPARPAEGEDDQGAEQDEPHDEASWGGARKEGWI